MESAPKIETCAQKRDRGTGAQQFRGLVMTEIHAFGQKWIFFSLFVFGEKGLGIRFDDVLVRKETFFDFKNKLFQCLKNGIFPEGLTQAFGQKMQFLSLFVFAQNKIRSRAY